MALITTHTISAAGTAPTFGAAAADDTAETGVRKILVVRNGSASSVTVTLSGQGSLPTGVDYPDREYTVDASGEAWIPLLAVYRNDDGVAEVGYSATADVTRAVVEV